MTASEHSAPKVGRLRHWYARLKPQRSQAGQWGALVLFSIVGVWVRLALLELLTYRYEAVFPLAYVQCVGCIAMGFVRETKAIQSEALAQWRPTALTAIDTLMAECRESRPVPSPRSPPAVVPPTRIVANRPNAPMTSMAFRRPAVSLRSQEMNQPDPSQLNPVDYTLSLVPYIATGLTTGLCGSITTFSSWQLDIVRSAFRIADPTGSHLFNPQNGFPPSSFKALLSGLSCIFVTWCVALGGLAFGRHLARAWAIINPWRWWYYHVRSSGSPYHKFWERQLLLPLPTSISIANGLHQEIPPEVTNECYDRIAQCQSQWERDAMALPFPNRRFTLHQVNAALLPVVVILGMGGWIGVIVASSLTDVWRHYMLSACFAPLGTLLRYWLARLNRLDANTTVDAEWTDALDDSAPSQPPAKSWHRPLQWAYLYLRASLNPMPWGTLLANIVGTMLLGVLFILGRNVFATSTLYHPVTRPRLFCQFRQALMEGLCGCLTTVSTLVVEVAQVLPGLRRRYVYALGSLVLGQLCMVFIVGFFEWFYQPDTVSGRLSC
ncbi:hypothetical protein H4R35_002825 [Dimargaris xerosporica]|nr:hypothetical protein H4R35_002825 [Dimargaris xerosporica]